MNTSLSDLGAVAKGLPSLARNPEAFRRATAYGGPASRRLIAMKDAHDFGRTAGPAGALLRSPKAKKMSAIRKPALPPSTQNPAVEAQRAAIERSRDAAMAADRKRNKEIADWARKRTWK